MFGESFESLLAAARAGAGWAFTRLYEALAPAVACYLAVQRAAEPDELTSDVVQRASWPSWPGWDWPPRPAWA